MAINKMSNEHKTEPKKGFKQWLKELLCGHYQSEELRVDKTDRKRKKHYHYCKKCSKRWYID